MKNLIAPYLGLYLTFFSLLGFPEKKNLRQRLTHIHLFGDITPGNKSWGRGLGVKQDKKKNKAEVHN